MSGVHPILTTLGSWGRRVAGEAEVVLRSSCDSNGLGSQAMLSRGPQPWVCLITVALRSTHAQAAKEHLRAQA